MKQDSSFFHLYIGILAIIFLLIITRINTTYQAEHELNQKIAEYQIELDCFYQITNQDKQHGYLNRCKEFAKQY